MSESKAKAVVKKQPGQIDYWANKEKIRQVFGKNLTLMEFDLFFAYGKAHGANPWIGEVVAVPFEGKHGRTVGFILTRDFRVKKANEQPDYDGHQAGCVYENDVHHFDGTRVIHEPPSMKKKERGEIIGAYCIAWKKGISHPFYIFRYFDEYAWRTSKDGKKYPKSNFWVDSPDTMMEKVAEAQLLKKCWPDIFNNTYDASELPSPNKRGVIEADFEEVPDNKREFIPPEEMQRQEPPPEPEPPKKKGKKSDTLFEQEKEKPGQNLYDLVAELYEEIEREKGQLADKWLKDNNFPSMTTVTTMKQYRELSERWQERGE